MIGKITDLVSKVWFSKLMFLFFVTDQKSLDAQVCLSFVIFSVYKSLHIIVFFIIKKSSGGTERQFVD